MITSFQDFFFSPFSPEPDVEADKFPEHLVSSSGTAFKKNFR